MKISSHWPEATNHLINLALGWGVLSVLLGFFYSFDAMESSTEVKASTIIPYFLRVTGITFLMGSILLSLPIFIWKLLSKKNPITKE